DLTGLHVDPEAHRSASAGDPLAGEEMLERLEPLEPTLAFHVGIGRPQERFQAHASRIEGSELHAQCELEVAEDACAVVGESEPLPLDDRGIDEDLANRLQVEGAGEVRSAFEANAIDPDLPRGSGIDVLQPDRPEAVVPVRYL